MSAYAHNSIRERAAGKPARRARHVFGLGCGATAAVMAIATFAYLKWANTLPPPERMPVRVMPNPNGHYARIAAADELAAMEGATEQWQVPWREDLDVLRRAVEKRKVPLDRLRAALRLPCCSPNFDPSNPDDSCPDYGRATFWFWGASRVARADGRYGDAMSSSLDAIELSVKLGRGGAVHQCLRGQDSLWGADAGERVVGLLSAAEAHTAGRRLDRVLRDLPTLAEALEAQRLVQLAHWREVLFNLPYVTTAEYTVPKGEQLRANFVSWIYPKSYAYAQMDRYYLRLIEVARLPYSARRFPPSGLETDPVYGGASFLWTSYDTGDTPEGVSCSFAENEAILRLFRTRLALQEYYGNHGRWPPTLQDATARLERGAVTDPFSGAPFLYRRQGNHFVLYSVGPDLKDDGGDPKVVLPVREDSRGDIVSGRRWKRHAREVSP